MSEKDTRMDAPQAQQPAGTDVEMDAGMEPGMEPVAEPSGGKKKGEKKSVGAEILSWVWTLLIAVALALVIRSSVFELVRVDGASMNDTLVDTEVMFVTKFDYSSTWLTPFWASDEAKESASRLTLFGNPQRFDVVVCRYPGRGGTNFVKRVVGLPGDTVEIIDGYLYVNGQKYDEPYINDAYRVSGGSNGQTFAAYTVPKQGDILVLKQQGNYLVPYLNGNAWTPRNSTIRAKDASGKELVIKSGGSSISYDGQDISDRVSEMLSQITDVDFTISQDYYFVMGDHRNNSNDSRSQGCIERSMIMGHVRQVVYPFGNWRGIQ